MTITYETEINGKKREIEDPDLVDMMVVRGKLRYADRQGGQGKMDSGRILEATGSNWEMIIKTPSGREQFSSANYIGIDGDDVFISGKKMAKKFEDSEIMRVRKQNP